MTMKIETSTTINAAKASDLPTGTTVFYRDEIYILGPAIRFRSLPDASFWAARNATILTGDRAGTVVVIKAHEMLKPCSCGLTESAGFNLTVNLNN